MRRGMDQALVVAALALLVALTGCKKDGANTFRISAEPASAGAEFWSALYQTTAARRVDGNKIDVVNNGDVFDVIAQEVAKAKQSVNVVVFIWRSGDPGDRLAEVLAERARAGVACRVLVDPVGSVDFEEKVKPVLEGAGCQTFQFRPIPADENLARNHRKIVVVDGRVAITGGFGIYESWLGDGRASKDNWRDTNARIEGPVVGQLQQAFAENWQEASGEIVPVADFPEFAGPVPAAGPSPAAFVASTASPEITRAERLTQLIVQASHKRLWIAQAYFTPNGVLSDLLVAKAQAGVDVRILAPGDYNDQKEITVVQRKSYDKLLAAGVRVWEYQPSMMHAKVMLADDAIAVVGSINYDPLSFNKLEEGSLVIEDAAVTERMASDFLADLEHSKEIRKD